MAGLTGAVGVVVGVVVAVGAGEVGAGAGAGLETVEAFSVVFLLGAVPELDNICGGERERE
jgi:hypothetical protein